VAFRVGPSVLMYGFVSQQKEVEGTRIGYPDQRVGLYRKYAPNQIRYDYDPETQERFRVTINDKGFRGADFEADKAPEVTRVLSLGASSTFGYFARDDETYPSYLEEILTEACPGRTFEVLNLGIPHLRSEDILALFLAEAISYEPDIVTYYQGINDNVSVTGTRKKLRKMRALRSIFHWFRRRSVLLTYSDLALTEGRERYDASQIDAHLGTRVQEYLRNVASIYAECRKRDIAFVVATQQAQSMLIPNRIDLRGLTYGEELDRVRMKLEKEHWLAKRELHFVTHAALMDGLRSWAESDHVPFVDAIAALDRDRDVLVSWVHLSPEGNRRLARELARGIVDEIHRTHRVEAPFCNPDLAGADPG